MATAVARVETQKITNEDIKSDSNQDAKIGELAYYKAENRGFEPGHELEDWLEAEQEYLLDENNDS